MSTLDRRTLLFGSVGVLGLGLLSLAGCARTQDDPQPSTSPDADAVPTIDDALPDVRLTRVFGQEVTGSTSFFALALVGSHVIAYDDTDAIDGRLLVVDAATGATAWAWRDVAPGIEAADPRVSALAPSTLTTAGGDDDAVLLASTYVNPCPEDAGLCSTADTDATSGHGIVAIGVASGDVRWNALVLPPVDRSDPASTLADDSTVEPVGGTADVAVVRAGEVEYVVLPSSAPAREDRVRTIGLSVVDGSVLWERPGIVATSVGTVIVAMRDDAGALGWSAIDPETGDDLWLAERGQTIGAAAAGVDALIVGDDRQAWLVDARTGDVLAPLVGDDAETDGGFGQTLGTDADGEPMAAWVANDPDAEDIRYQLWTSTGEAARPGSEGIGDYDIVTAVRGGYSWCTDNDRIHARDRSGAERSEGVPGILRGLGDERLLVETDGGFDLYALG